MSGLGPIRPDRRVALHAGWIALALGFALALGVSGGCGGDAAAAPGSAGGGEAGLPVSVARVERRDVPVRLRAVGMVDSPSSVVVKPQVAGRIEQVSFAEGDEVKAGDVLIVLDRRSFEAAVRSAEAQLARDTAMARDAVLAAEQMESALDSQAISKRTAQQQRATADAAQATVAGDEAALAEAKLQLEYCTVRAPLDGRTGRLAARVGSVVKENETELVTINQMAPVRVVFAVPQDQLGEIRRRAGQGPLTVTAEPPQEEPVAGRLTFIDNAVDSATGTIRLMGTFGNEDRRLWPGQYVDVALEVSVDQDAVVVPNRALQTGQAGSYVFVVGDDRTVEQRPVSVRRTADDDAVIAEGLQGGETVVTDGQLRLVDGARVQFEG